MKRRQEVSLTSRVQAVKDQISADLVGEVAILHLKSGVYYGLNPMGAEIWKWIQTPRQVREICDWMLREFDLDPKRCHRDLFSFLQELSSEGLIKVQ